MIKNILIIVFVFLFFKINAQTTYPSGVTGCVARWTFDASEGGQLDSIFDVSGNQNHGNNNYITSTLGWKKIPNTAGDFDGTSSFSQVPYNANFLSNQVTSIALIKVDSFYSGQCQGNNIIYNGFNYNADQNWGLYIAEGHYDNSCTTFSPNNEKLFFTTPNYVPTGVPTSNYIQPNKWYFLACSYNGSQVKYYQVQMDSLNKLTTISPSYSAVSSYAIGNGTYDVFIGATQNPPFPYWFNGSMDEVIVFNKALTDNEMYSVYDFLYGPSPSGIETNLINEKINLQIKNDYLLISDEENKIQNIALYDITGRTIKNIEKENLNSIYVGSLPEQIYLVKIFTKNKQVVFKKVSLVR